MACYLGLLALALIPLAPLLDGVKRKIVAVVQRRVGPPMLQTWYDFAKLFGRRTSAPENATLLYTVSPIASFLLSLTALAMLSYPPAAEALGGTIGFMVVVEASAFTLLMGVIGLSPFTSAGAARLWLAGSVAEAGALLGLIAVSHTARGLVVENCTAQCVFLLALALAAAGFVELELPPYNVAEAGPEIAAGPYTEYQGPLLALAVWSSMLRGLALLYASFYSALAMNPLEALAATVLAYVVYAVAIASASGRPRPLRAAGLASISLAAGAAVLVLA